MSTTTINISWSTFILHSDLGIVKFIRQAWIDYDDSATFDAFLIDFSKNHPFKVSIDYDPTGKSYYTSTISITASDQVLLLYDMLC